MLVLACALLFPSHAALAQPVEPKYLYNLSTFAGPIREDWVRLHVDVEHDEIYVLYQNRVRVFNASGMEIFSFGDGLELGQIVDLAVDANGDIFVLSSLNARSLVTRCNYRGVPIAPVEISKLPPDVAFAPTRMFLRKDAFYFVAPGASTVFITDRSGEFRKHVEFNALIADEGTKNPGGEIMGVTVDRDGNLFFTVATLFKVFKYSADGQLASFGTSGSGAGKFGVVAGVAVDSRGHILVADKLKSVVMIFDKDFAFIREFGYRGAAPANLIVPDDISIDGKDRVYVSQGRKRGVSVFALTR